MFGKVQRLIQEYTMTFSEKDKAVLIGLIIGDGCLSKENALKIAHSAKQRDYCVYKAKLVHSIFGGSDIKVHDSISKYKVYINGEAIIKQAETC